MEILSQSIKRIILTDLNQFQIQILKVIKSLLNEASQEQVSNDSFINEGAFLDFIIKSAKDNFILALSIRKDVVHINSKYFDIYVYDETSIAEIETLIKDIMIGNYIITFHYDKKDNLIEQSVIFDKKLFSNYNQRRKISFFSKKITQIKQVKGYIFLENN